MIILFSCCTLRLRRRKESAWRQATDAELASLLPARAPVEKEHIETEMRTASGIVDQHGPLHRRRGAAHCRLLGRRKVLALSDRAGADADRWDLRSSPANMSWMDARRGDALNVHFNKAATGAWWAPRRRTGLRVEPRGEPAHLASGRKALIQIGRFGIPYELGEE